MAPVHWAVSHRSPSREEGGYTPAHAHKKIAAGDLQAPKAFLHRARSAFSTRASRDEHFTAVFSFLCLRVSCSLSLGLMTGHTSQCVGIQDQYRVCGEAKQPLNPCRIPNHLRWRQSQAPKMQGEVSATYPYHSQ